MNDEVHVADTNGDSWLFAANGSVSYERTFACGGDEGGHPNVATIVETGQSSSASVTVACYRPTVTKNAETSYRRTYDWNLTKSADQTELILSEGQQFWAATRAASGRWCSAGPSSSTSTTTG